ncbi:hypothetical protein ACH9L7_16995 (plasmid) [Haloferax sp. S1W]|uniref:hypothetical protein n=1 Tax=Haloferax sp. S1W TaxID=3377110 RepID=UPI0037C67687
MRIPTLVVVFVGSREGWTRCGSITVVALFAVLLGYVADLLGRSAFAIAGPAPPVAAALVTLVLGIFIGYRYTGMLIAWVTGLGIHLMTAVAYLLEVRTTAPVAFLLTRLVDLIAWYGLGFSTIGFVVGWGTDSIWARIRV